MLHDLCVQQKDLLDSCRKHDRPEPANHFDALYLAEHNMRCKVLHKGDPGTVDFDFNENLAFGLLVLVKFRYCSDAKLS